MPRKDFRREEMQYITADFKTAILRSSLKDGTSAVEDISCFWLAPVTLLKSFQILGALSTYYKALIGESKAV